MALIVISGPRDGVCVGVGLTGSVINLEVVLLEFFGPTCGLAVDVFHRQGLRVGADDKASVF